MTDISTRDLQPMRVDPLDLIAKFGADAWTISPEDGQKMLAEDIKSWAGFIKLANIEPQG